MLTGSMRVSAVRTALPFLLLFLTTVSFAQDPSASASSSGDSSSSDPDSTISDPPPVLPGKRYWEASSAAMAESLGRLGNYTCIQHIRRQVKGRRDPVLRQMDTVRLQVTSLGSEEFYAFPGDKQPVSNPRELMPAGMSGTGFFQGYAHSIFVRKALEKLEFLGTDGAGATRLLRFRFLLNPDTDPLVIRIGSQEAAVPARGEFWLSGQDFLVRRIAVENVAPVRSLGISRVLYVMDWAPVTTPGGRMLLPENVEAVIQFRSGEVHRNEITLAQCREYRADSSIRFDTEDDAAEDAGDALDDRADEVPTEGFLPSGVTIETALVEAVSLASAGVGDTLRVVLTKPVVRRGKEVLPAGLEVQGRVRRVDRYTDPTPHTVAWLEFSVFTLQGSEYTFLAEMTERDPLPALVDRVPNMKRSGSPWMKTFANYESLSFTEPTYRAVPGIGSFVFTGELPTLPAGYKIQWKTVSPRP